MHLRDITSMLFLPRSMDAPDFNINLSLFVVLPNQARIPSGSQRLSGHWEFFRFPQCDRFGDPSSDMEKSELAPDPWFLYLMLDVGVWYDSKELLLLFFCDGDGWSQGVLSIYQHLAWICWFWMTSRMLLTCWKSADTSTRVALTSPWWETCMSPTDLSPCHLI